MPARTVPDDHGDVLDAGDREIAESLLGQLRPRLDRPNVLGKTGQDGGVVSRAGTHVKHTLVPIQDEQLAHPRDDERLGDRLTRADRQRLIGPRAPALVLGDEALPRHHRDRVQHPFVGDDTTQPLDKRLSATRR